MQAMQYTIKLPSDYDMDIIRQRPKYRSFDLDSTICFSKVYLISESLKATI